MKTAKGRLESLVQLQKSATEDFRTMLHYFGEDPATMKTTEIFSVFSEFITKFEVSSHFTILQVQIPHLPPLQPTPSKYKYM